MTRTLLNLVAGSLLLLAAGAGAGANTVVVANTADTGIGSLRQAIAAAASGDTIDLTGTTGTIALATPLTIDKSLRIQGPGADRLTLSGGGVVQILRVGDERTVSVDGLTFTGGKSTAWGGPLAGGGAIEGGEQSVLTLSRCTFAGNQAVAGGAIMAYWCASLAVTDCLFTANIADEHAGAVFGPQSGSSFAITNCVFNGNWGRYTSAIVNSAEGGAASIVNSTFAGNTSENGWCIRNEGDATFTNDTFASNSSGTMWYSAAVINLGYLKVCNCILWGNTPNQIFTISPPERSARTDADHTLVEGGLAGTGNLDTDPQFVRTPNPAIGDFGNLRLQPGSPCVDSGANAAVTIPPFPVDGAGQAVDLDGLARIVDFDANGLSTADMGAYELRVHAPTATEGVQTLENAVRALVQLGAMLPANGQSLYAKLDAALAALEAGDTATAIQKLQDFISQVRSFIKVGKLTTAQGQPLIDQATAVLHLLGA